MAKRFDELLYNDDVLDALDAMHFEECTPVQEQAIPIVEEGRDLIAIAQTGTGKTAAYLLPVIDQLADGGFPEDAVNCVVMVPTRELVQQIDLQMQGFSYYLPITSTAIYGGTDGKVFDQQKRGLTSGADVIIATPGRLLAHLSMGYVDLSNVSFFILDEADRMLDMGFFDDIMQIVAHLPKERQTLLFSATMPPKIKQLASKILTDPAEVKIAVSKPAEKIDQSAYVCYETQKEALICHLFQQTPPDRVIVFSSSKLKVKQLTRTLRSKHISVGEMHSDLDQDKREEVMLDFKAGRIKVLIATDIVARGIDINDISLVINYDVPHEAEDYVHRVGRTARAEHDGRAITFISEKDRIKFQRIEQLIEKEVRKEPLPADLGSGPDYGGTRKHRGERNDRRARGSRDGKKHKAHKSDKPHDVVKANLSNTDNKVEKGASKTENAKKRRNHRGGRRHRRRGEGDSGVAPSNVNTN